MSRPALLLGLAAAVAVSLVPATTASADTGADPVVTRERGYALTCTGTLARSAVTVTLYTNDTVTVPASILVEGPRAPRRRGGGAPAPRIAHGRVLARARMVADGAERPSGTAVVVGSYRRSGPVVEVHDDFVDDEERIQVDGTNQQLSTRLTVVYQGRSARLTSCSDAFAYDVTTTRTPI